jgi:hypothetical protein
MTVVATLPQTTVPAGPGSLTSGVLAASAAIYIAKLQQVTWPHAGDKAFDYVCDVSLDGGATWLAQPPSSGDVYDGAIPSRNGSTADQIVIACQLPDVGNANRKLRLSYNLAKALTVSGTLEAA